ncbi:hypothetical protein HMPREF9628_00564 [Peptoanaerobacter stomatis]|uniref:Transporter, auxin efflux carrier domain protein n=1 Tax=Peptoanaerobacter stomatis TaxID=796937 RepID=G9XEY6_9FIRM|nr:AEC family transporter [Peptoanaerobacter stomatis]EHL17966.1 hypothetical protein HMPREF9628_00564 [Peptoanaerobacter stomatis]
MESFYIAFNAVAPISFLVIFGYYLKEKKYLAKETISNLNKLCFNIFLPVLTFSNILHTNVREIFDIKLFIYVFISIIAMVVALSMIVPFIEPDSKKQGALIQGIYRSNFVILGIPLTNHIAGNAGAFVASILIMVVIPMYNMLAVIVLATHSGRNTDLKNVLKEIVKNPLIIASILAIILSLLNVKMPQFVDKIILDLAKIGGVLPMIMLGSMLDFKKISSNIRNIFIGVFGRLILMPLIFLTIAIALGFSSEKIVALIAMYCAPTAVSSALMAEQMGCDYELAAQIIIFTTVISCFTIFLWVFTLDFLKFI